MADLDGSGARVRASSIKLVELANELSGGDPRQLVGALMLAAGSVALGLGISQDKAVEKFASGLALLERALERADAEGSDAVN